MTFIDSTIFDIIQDWEGHMDRSKLTEERTQRDSMKESLTCELHVERRDEHS